MNDTSETSGMTFFFCVVCSFCALLLPLTTVAAEERMHSYVVHIELQPNGSAFVQEEIVYDFGETPHHGIFRRIPLVYQSPEDGRERVIAISSIMVTDGFGNFRQTAYEEGGNVLELKIGDPELTVTGKQFYVIRYTVWGATYELRDNNQVAFYWNATGNDWPSVIDRARVDVVFPVPINEDRITDSCVVGYSGRTIPCNRVSSVPTEGDGTTITMRRYEHDGLLPHEGMTVMVGLPQGTIKAVGVKKEFESRIVHWWNQPLVDMTLVIPLFVFFILFAYWWKYGRDVRGAGTVIPEYAVPDGLTPMEAGVLWHNHLESQGITGGIIGLAVQGYVRIRKVKKPDPLCDTEEFIITKQKEPDAVLSNAERSMMDALFQGETRREVLLSQLTHQRVLLNTILTRIVFAEMARSGYIVPNALHVRRDSLIAGLGIMLIAFFLPALNFAFVLSGGIVLLFGWCMPKRTSRGTRIKERLAGLRDYLAAGEGAKISSANAPEKNPELFERLLPYAIVFDVAHAWSAQFADSSIPQKVNRWYTGSDAQNAMAITTGLVGFAHAIGVACNSPEDFYRGSRDQKVDSLWRGNSSNSSSDGD